MFCPKCGLQNTDETKFCRVCGADLSSVLAVIDGRSLPAPALSEKYIDLYGSGLKGVIIGAGLLAASGVAFAVSINLAVMSMLFLALGFYFFGTGVSRLVQAKKIKALSNRNEPAALPRGGPEYIKPLPSIYETDGLLARPFGVTEHTTRQLKSDE